MEKKKITIPENLLRFKKEMKEPMKCPNCNHDLIYDYNHEELVDVTLNPKLVKLLKESKRVR